MVEVSIRYLDFEGKVKVLVHYSPNLCKVLIGNGLFYRAKCASLKTPGGGAALPEDAHVKNARGGGTALPEDAYVRKAVGETVLQLAVTRKQTREGLTRELGGKELTALPQLPEMPTEGRTSEVNREVLCSQPEQPILVQPKRLILL